MLKSKHQNMSPFIDEHFAPSYVY